MVHDRQDGGKPEGFSKYLKRMKNVLHYRSASKNQSLVAPGGSGSAKTETEPTPASVPVPTLRLEPVEPAPVVMTSYSNTQYERTRALFAKYGLPLNPDPWKTPAELQPARVTKPIRMRVHRTCHRCETTFGTEKICINCSHTRCTKCPRFPPARANDGEPRLRRSSLHDLCPTLPRAQPMTSYLKYTGDSAHPLKKSSRTGGQDLIQKPVRQRVHRNCHLCTQQFAHGSKECGCCGHIRCKSCPRDPAHLGKYPDGYPGDVDPFKPLPSRTLKQPRSRIHYICHVCETAYRQAENACFNCGQAKCAQTIRFPPRKIKREPDPAVLRSVEEKLANLAITANLTANPGFANAGGKARTFYPV